MRHRHRAQHLRTLARKSAGLWGAVVFIGIAGAAHRACSAEFFAKVSDMFPKRAIGSVIGFGGMAGSVGGMLFPIFSGCLLDRFGICAGAYPVAFGLSQLLAPRFEQIETGDVKI